MQTLKISVADILGRPGESRRFHLSPILDGIATALARLEESPLSAQVRLESVVEGILVTGHVQGRATMECARCLSPLEGPIGLELCELFSESLPEEDAYRFSGTEIDLEPMLRDAVALALPLNPLCRSDCRGICAGCGRNLAEQECECTTDDTDPRWAPLAALREKLQS